MNSRARTSKKQEIKGVELRGEAYLTDSVMIRGSYARIAGVEIVKDATVPPLAAETPLASIAPNEGVLGIRYAHPSGRWGSDLSLRLVESYQGAPDEDQFTPTAYQVVDLVSHVSLTEALTWRLGLLNPDGRDVLRVVERAGTPGERPGDRPVLKPRDSASSPPWGTTGNGGQRIRSDRETACLTIIANGRRGPKGRRGPRARGGGERTGR